LKAPAFGLNYAKAGATTKSFRSGNYWAKVIAALETYNETNNCFVTIQVRICNPFDLCRFAQLLADVVSTPVGPQR